MPFGLHHILHGHNPSDNAHSSERRKDYVFEDHVIGVGGYSQVVKAKWQSRDNMVVAMKVVRKEAVQDRAEYLKIVRV